MAVDFTLKREERGNRPEAQRGPQKVAVHFLGQEQCCVEDGFPLMTQYAAISASSAPKSLRLSGDPFAARSDFEIGSSMFQFEDSGKSAWLEY